MTDCGRSPDGSGYSAETEPSCTVSAVPVSIPNAAALSVRHGLYLDETNHVYPVTNWFDEDGDECLREDAVACVAGEGGIWFALSISDFGETPWQA